MASTKSAIRADPRRQLGLDILEVLAGIPSRRLTNWLLVLDAVVVVGV